MGSVMWLSSYFLFPVLDAACRVLARGGGESNTDPGFPYGLALLPPPATPPPAVLAACPQARCGGMDFSAGPIGAGSSLRVELCSSSRAQEGGGREVAASL